MSIYKNAVYKPITTLMIFTAIIVLGMYSLTNIPIDLYPEMNPPFISVMTSYPGANGADIETNVTKTIEDALNTVDKLKEITSVSLDNLSVVNLEFEWEANLDEASNDIRDAIDRIFDYLPEDCDRPTVFKFNTSMIPILFYAVTADESYAGLDKLIDEKIINPLNRIEGIGSISMVGSPRRVIYVNVDPKRLDAYNLTLEQIGSVIMSENMNMPSGNVKMGKMDYQLRVQGEFTESAQLNNIVVGSFGGRDIFLKDVAEVNDTIRDVSLDEKINGETGMRMFIMKQSGGNTVRIVRQINKRMDELIKTLPPDVKIQKIFDTSVFIRDSINNLAKTLMWALLFVVLVILFFLGRWRATFIVVLTIPISLIVSFIYLFITGSSLNIISLTSLTIAIGMVVDDAIVVLENITKHIERGSRPREAAIYATNEVWLSVIITTLVVVAVFFPLTLVSGMTGVLFNELGWIVSITVTTSTVAAISLTPMLASQLLKLREKAKNRKKFSYENTIERFLNWLDRFYEKTLRWSLIHKRWVMIVSLFIFVSSFFLFKYIGTDFIPESDESQLSANIQLQTGLRVEETMKVARELEDIIRERYPEAEIYSMSSGSDDEGGFLSLFAQTGSNIINTQIQLIDVDQRERSVWEIANDFRTQLDLFPEIINYNVTTSNSGFGGATNVVNVEIYGYDFNTTNKLADEIKNRLEKLEGATDIQVSRKEDKPELQVILDREKLMQHGLSNAMVSAAIRNRVDGLIASRFREEGDEYNIEVRFKEEYRNSITDLEEITLINPMGMKIKLKELGEVREYWSPPNIERKRRERIVTVSVKPVSIPLGTLANMIKEELKGVEVPREVMINVGGAYEDQQESFMDLALLLVLSLVLVFLVMASQFESFKMPFIIMFSIPFAFTGVTLALFITGTTLSVIAALGAVLLVGIVVKNGIVLVDYINLMRDRGIELYEAIAISGKSRLRPVLMTAMTTILGMLPLAMSTGVGSELWSPMGITVIGGLIFSTIITMVIVPVMYAVFARKGEREKKAKIRSKFVFMNNNHNQ